LTTAQRSTVSRRLFPLNGAKSHCVKGPNHDAKIVRSAIEGQDRQASRLARTRLASTKALAECDYQPDWDLANPRISRDISGWQNFFRKTKD
jgi:hypothetical protein